MTNFNYKKLYKNLFYTVSGWFQKINPIVQGEMKFKTICELFGFFFDIYSSYAKILNDSFPKEIQMKKFLYLFIFAVLCVTLFSFTAYAEDSEQLLENSWRYKDGELIMGPYSVSFITDPYHPDATFTGIDISHHQGQIDWERVKESGVDFAIIRCGYAEDKEEYDDRCWEYNSSECERLGIPYGVYLYSYAENVKDALSEADHVLRLIEGKNPSLPVYYDLEENYMIETGLDFAAVATAFCERIEDAGYSAGVYANLNWWTYYLTDKCFDNWHRWVARWNTESGYDGKMAIWQYYNMGIVDGINGDVDMNFLIGTPDDHKVWTEKLGTPQIKLSNDGESGKPVLSWDAVEGAAEYQVWNKTSSSGRYKLYKTTTETSMTNADAEVGKAYYYKVKAISADNSTGDSYISGQKYITCDLPRPSVTVSNVASTGKIKLSWNAVEGAGRYEVERATAEDGEYILLTTTEKTSVINTKITAGDTYYYRVRAIHASKTSANSAYSEIVHSTCALPKPVNLKASNVASTGKPKLTWDDVNGADVYEIYRAEGESAGYALIGTADSGSFTDETALPGITYSYKVKAAISTNPSAGSAASSAVSRTCDVARPVLKLSNVASTGKIKLSWDAVEGADEYGVYRATSKNGTYTLLTTTEKTSVINTKTTAGNTYYYKLKAICADNSSANSAYSAVVYRMCDLERPVVKASNVSSTGKIKLSWNAVSGAAKYSVYRATEKDGEYKLLGSTAKTTYTNTSPKAGQTYYYKVKAIHSGNSSANSAYSSVVSRTCDLAAPSAKISLSLSGKPKIKWNKVEDADRYTVYRSTSKDGTYTALKTVTGTAFTNTAAVKGQKYYYKVKAICDETSSANSAYSSVVYITSK